MSWEITLKKDLEPITKPRVFGYAQLRTDWVKNSCELWAAKIRDDEPSNFYTMFQTLLDPFRGVSLPKPYSCGGIPTFLRSVNATEI